MKSTIIDNIVRFFQNSIITDNEAPEGLCPNCWGQQEYGNTVRDLYKDKQIDVNNHEAHYAFIQEFVVNKIDGITLRKGENGYVCPTCHLKKD